MIRLISLKIKELVEDEITWWCVENPWRGDGGSTGCLEWWRRWSWWVAAKKVKPQCYGIVGLQWSDLNVLRRHLREKVGYWAVLVSVAIEHHKVSWAVFDWLEVGTIIAVVHCVFGDPGWLISTSLSGYSRDWIRGQEIHLDEWSIVSGAEKCLCFAIRLFLIILLINS